MSDSLIPHAASIGKDVSDALKTLLKDLYADLAKPSVQAVGKAIGTLVETSNTFLIPITQWQQRRRLVFEQNMKRFEEALEAATADGSTVIAAAPEVGNPILDKLAYVADEDLCHLFIQLLRRASIAEEAGLAHPRFVDIVSNLSPDEARTLRATAKSGYFRCLSLQWEKVEKRSKDKTTTIFFRTNRCLTGLEQDHQILFPQNIFRYLISLQSLGVLSIFEDTAANEADPPYQEYESLRETYRTTMQEGRKNKGGYASRILLGRIEYTDFGKFFLEACVLPALSMQERENAASDVHASEDILQRADEQDAEIAEVAKADLTELDKHFHSLRRLLKDLAFLFECEHHDLTATLWALQRAGAVSAGDRSEVDDFLKVYHAATRGETVDELSLAWSLRTAPVLEMRLRQRL